MPTARDCAHCGASFTPPGKGSKARFCCGAHRVAALKNRKMGLPEARVTLLPSAVDEPSTTQLLTLEEVAGVLAAKLLSSNTPPTATAGIARVYVTTLAEIESRAPKAKGRIDELMERRARRGSA